VLYGYALDFFLEKARRNWRGVIPYTQALSVTTGKTLFYTKAIQSSQSATSRLQLRYRLEFACCIAAWRPDDSPDALSRAAAREAVPQ
jgi:hypothetical protein